MNYEEFLTSMKEDLKSDLEQEGYDVIVEIADVKNVKEGPYRGLSFRKKASNVGVTLNAKEAYAAYENGAAYSSVKAKIKTIVADGLGHSPKVDLQVLDDYEQMKKLLAMELLPKAGNEALLEELPHKDMEDLAVIFMIEIRSHEGERIRISVTREMMEKFGITDEQLYKDACEYAPILHPAIFKTVTDMIAGFMGMDASCFFPEPVPIMVATTDDAYKGAAVILYPGFLQKVADDLECSYFVLPSSIHEMLIIRDDGVSSYEELSSMVPSINEEQVMPDERLSDNVYYYDRETKAFGLAKRKAFIS